MTFDNNNREKKLREFYEATGSKGALWIDDATGKIVDRSSRPEPQTAPYEVARPGIEIPRRPVRDVRPAFIDLVGPRSSVTMEDGARAERTRLSARVVRLLPARGGGS
jgi:hypothetical protein